jgi:hypothetical protein
MACSRETQAALRGTSTPICARRSVNSARSSVSSMVLMGVPSTATPNFSRVPSRESARPQFSAVWPPKLRAMASGRSRSITCATNSGVTGRKYTRSASAAEVWMVAMLGFTSTVAMPSSFSALIAWLPE